MTSRPNALQRLLHRFFMLRTVTAFFAPRIHHLDNACLKLTAGRFSLSEVLGWRIIQLTAVGVRTGMPRTIPLLALDEGDCLVLIASSFGRPRHPAWYHNLKVHPECMVAYKGQEAAYTAEEAEGEVRDKYWQTAVSIYRGFEAYSARAGRRIPIMVLKPRHP